MIRTPRFFDNSGDADTISQLFENLQDTLTFPHEWYHSWGQVSECIDTQVKDGYSAVDYFSVGPPEAIDENNNEGLQLVLPCDDPQGTTDQNRETE